MIWLRSAKSVCASLPVMPTRSFERAPTTCRTGGAEMTKAVEIAGRQIGHDGPSFVVAEIGINHNGDLGLARKLIAAAVTAGCDAVKFQKRTIDIVYSADELERPRESPFGTTNGELKRALEFGDEEFRAIE